MLGAIAAFGFRRERPRTAPLPPSLPELGHLLAFCSCQRVALGRWRPSMELHSEVGCNGAFAFPDLLS